MATQAMYDLLDEILAKYPSTSSDEESTPQCERQRRDNSGSDNEQSLSSECRQPQPPEPAPLDLAQMQVSLAQVQKLLKPNPEMRHKLAKPLSQTDVEVLHAFASDLERLS